MCLKIISKGFIFGKSAYLQDNWNSLDFVIVLISVISLAFANGSIRALRALRALRVLRPLRLISRLRGLRVVFGTIVRSGVALFYTLLVVGAIWFVFAILGFNRLHPTSTLTASLTPNCCDYTVVGVNIFSGKFWSCSNGMDINYKYTSKENCNGTYMDAFGASRPMVWQNEHFNYDNIFVGMYTIFTVITLTALHAPPTPHPHHTHTDVTHFLRFAFDDSNP